MIDKDTARSIALAEINKPSQPIECVILDQHTMEENFGWVFFYQSRRCAETGDEMEMLVGNAPLIVNRQDGSVYYTGTAYPTEWYIEQYRELLNERLVIRTEGLRAGQRRTVFIQPNSLRRLYQIRNEGFPFSTGRLADGTQILMGPQPPELVIVEFDADGKYRTTLAEEFGEGEVQPTYRCGKQRPGLCRTPSVSSRFSYQSGGLEYGICRNTTRKSLIIPKRLPSSSVWSA